MWDPPAGAPTLVGASWGARLGAYFIDGLIATLFYIPGIVVFFAGPTEIKTCEVDSSGNIVLGGNGANALCEGPTGTTWLLAIVLYLAGLVAYLIMRGRMEGKTGQTIGKKALSIRTVDARTGQPIGTGRAIGRFFGYIISGLICYLGFLWALWDKDNQAWHDKIVTSRVVKA